MSVRPLWLAFGGDAVSFAVVTAPPRWFGSAAVLILFSLMGCNKQARPTLMADMAKKEITVSQLRAVNYEYAARFGHAVAARTHEIIVATEDRDVVQHALRWRTWAQPQARVASFDQDPLVALIELWILADQQHQFFTVGGGSAWFGAQQEHAQATTLALRQKAEALMADTMTPDALRTIRETKRDWVATHPIEGKLVSRPTARADLANLVPPRQSGTLRAVPSMQESLGDMNDRITILSDQAPTEARWQAEFLVASLFDDRLYGEHLDTVVGSLEEMTGFLDTFEETAARQTAAIFDGIESERVMIFDAMERERAEILAALTEEREAILSGVDSQLSSTTSNMDEVARGLIDDTTAELDGVARGLIDHFFIRLAQFLVIVGVCALLYRWVTRRRRNAVVDHDRTE